MTDRTVVHICLVDDDEDYFVITRDCLAEMEEFACKVTWRSTYQAARDDLIRGDYDVCLLDYQLGPHNGLELLRELVKAGCRTPVIMLTGQNDRQIDLEAMQAGAADYLLKGQVDAETLERSMRYVLKQHRIQEELRESRDSLNAAKTQLEDALKKINDEMETAKRVQKSLLPRDIAVVKGLEFEATYLPSGSIGGDLYDVVPIDESRSAVIVLDACGHGVPSAFISAMAKISFSRYTRRNETCSSILRQVNTELCAFMPEGRFITAFVVIIDTAKMEMSFSRAAHPPAMLYRHASGTIEHLSTRGSFVGLSPNAHFDEQTVRLQSGDVIVLYSDGLIESSDGQGHFFEKKGLETALRDAMVFAQPRVLNTILDEWSAFTRNLPQHDDMTLVTIRVL